MMFICSNVDSIVCSLFAFLVFCTSMIVSLMFALFFWSFPFSWEIIFFPTTMKLTSAAYLHMMEGLGFGFHGKCKIVTAFDIKKVWDGPLMVNVGLTKEIAEGLIRSGAADLAAFGRPYIANPDLVERFKNDWPLNPLAPYETWWTVGAGAKGYTDFETYKAPADVETKEE